MWVQQAPPLTKPVLTPLLRPKPGDEIYGKLCGEQLRIFLHYASRRSWPCVGRGCHLCEHKIPRRYYSYYPVRDHKGVLGILELTSQAEDQLKQQIEPETQVNSGEVWLRRAHGRRNMPCSIKWKASENSVDEIVESISISELQNALLRIWKLPLKNGDQDESSYLAMLNEVIYQQTIRRQGVAGGT